MAGFSGELGSVTWAGANEHFVENAYAWEFSENTNTIDNTAFQPVSGYRTFVAGLITGSGRVSCYLSDTDEIPIQGRTITSMVLTAGKGTVQTMSFSFDAFVTEVRLGSRLDGIATVDISFQISGPVDRISAS